MYAQHETIDEEELGNEVIFEANVLLVFFVLFTWAKCVVSAINDASLSCSMFSLPGME